MGRLPVGLNAEGRRQARLLGTALKEVAIDRIYTSPLKRACETAAFLKNGRRIRLEKAEALKEIEYGQWVGRTFSEIRYDPAYRIYHTQPSRSRVPGGESLIAVRKRAVGFIESLRKKWSKGGMLVTVSHADVIKLILTHYLSLDIDNFQRIRIDNGSLSLLFFEESPPKGGSPKGGSSRGPKRERVITINSHPYLDKASQLWIPRRLYG